ncbi:MAG: hypothetical protein EOM73_17600, partial [Bacteroidia bacterium]|nr:hypothetical protein [Bacteroidia bacterium]
DCRKSNLVIGTNQQAIVNAKLSSNNTSGYKGVFWDRRVKLWVAYLSCGGTRHHAGYFKEKEKAIEARKRLEELYQNHLKLFPKAAIKIVQEL